MLKSVIVIGATLATGAVFAAETSRPPRAPQLVFAALDQTSGYAEGLMYVRAQPRAGAVSAIDLASTPIRSWHLDNVPASVIGPPACIAANRAGSQILVASGVRPDPADGDKLVPDSRVTRLQLGAKGLEIVSQLDVGRQPSGITMSQDGKRAWVALRAEGAIAELKWDGRAMTLGTKSTFTDEQASLSDVALSPDETTLLASLQAKDVLLVLRIETDGRLTQRQEIPAKSGPYHIRFFPDGHRALVGCTKGDFFLIVAEKDGRWAVTGSIATGRTPETIDISPDGKWIVAGCFDGANMAIKKNRWYGQPPRVYVYSVAADGAVTQTQTLDCAGIIQSAVFTPDGRQLVVGQFGLGNVRIYELSAGRWHDTRVRIEVPGQPAALIAGGR